MVVSLGLAILSAVVSYTAERQGLHVLSGVISEGGEEWGDVKIGDQAALIFAKSLSTNHAILGEALFWSVVFLVFLVLLLRKPRRKDGGEGADGGRM